MSKYTLVYTLCLPTFVLSLYFEENGSGVVTFLNHHDYHTRLLTHDNDSVPFQKAAITVEAPFLFVCLDAFFGPEQRLFLIMVDLVYTLYQVQKFS